MGGFKLYFPVDKEDVAKEASSSTAPTSTCNSQFLSLLGDGTKKQPADTASPADGDAAPALAPRNPSWKQDQSESVVHPTTPGREYKTYREHTLEKRDKRRTSLSIPTLEGEGEDSAQQEMNFRSYGGGRRRSSAQRSADYYTFMDGMVHEALGPDDGLLNSRADSKGSHGYHLEVVRNTEFKEETRVKKHQQ